MKKILVIIANVLIMFGILFFVVQYANNRSVESYQAQISDFETMTVSVERVTANYLEEEQRICDTWAGYINVSDMYIDEAVLFLANSQTVAGVTAQLVYPDIDGWFSGYSTAPHSDEPENYSVSYRGIDIFSDAAEEVNDNSSVHITRAYTNPVNGIQSIAFYNAVTVTDALASGAEKVNALLLRVLPVSLLEEKWVFPNEEYKDAEISLIDADGNYMIRSPSLKNSNFYEFYKSYNLAGPVGTEELRLRIVGGTGSMAIRNSKSETCLIAFTPIMLTDSWTLISYIPMTSFETATIDWFFVGIVFAGLILLSVFDFALLILINRKLRNTAIEAENANKAKTYFLSTMSHDIRTPMNTILGMNEMILRECNDEDIVVYSEHIRTSGNTLLSLINDILDFSKIEAGKLDIIPVDYDFTSVLNDLVNMAQTAAEAKGLELRLNIDQNIPKLLRGDEIRIKQATTNIITNAIKYTKKGTVTITIWYEKAEEDPDCIMLNVSVKDTGVGIREEDIDKLFAAFQRVDEAGNRGIEGTGLGLTITQSLLDMMGSTLAVRSEYGKGSEFGFSLKQRVLEWDAVGDYETAFKRSVAERKTYKEMFTAPDAKVLVVDDTSVNLTVFKSLLKRTGMQIDTAESGDECVLRAARTKYDIIFLDHMMPQKDGIETLGDLKKLKDNPNVGTPVICLTANAVSGMREMYLEVGFDDYLTKPIDPDKLENAILVYLPAEKVKPPATENTEDNTTIPELLYHIDDIDVGTGLKHCGTAEAYIETVMTYLETAETNADEIEKYWREGDVRNTTVKVHALKSTSRVIGASELGAFAEKLEKAGNENDMETLAANIDRLIADYRRLAGKLAPLAGDAANEEDLPVISSENLAQAYAAIREFYAALDYDSASYVIESLSGYRIPDSEKERCEKLKKAAFNFDYDLIPGILEKGDN